MQGRGKNYRYFGSIRLIFYRKKLSLKGLFVSKNYDLKQKLTLDFLWEIFIGTINISESAVESQNVLFFKQWKKNPFKFYFEFWISSLNTSQPIFPFCVDMITILPALALEMKSAWKSCIALLETIHTLRQQNDWVGGSEYG